ncbi:recombination directionality factor [Nocardioides pakistanensis]
MPISPIVLQRRHAELGRIRLGAKTTTSSGASRPSKLGAFRFTSPSERYIRDLAELYGGQPREWDNNGKPEWEVFTDATSIPVIAVKGGLSQWMETWSGGGCIHRCDGERGADGDLCNPEDRAHLEAKPTTRLSVMLPELEAIGVWRMESHGWNAAAEIPAVAELAQYVGDLVPAHLHLVERRSVKDGKTSRFVVPVLDLQIGTARLKEIVAEKSGGTAAAVESGQPQRAALEAGPSTEQAADSGLSLPTEDDIAGASLDGLRAMWKYLDSHGALETNGLGEKIMARVQQLQAAGKQQPAAAEEPVDAEIVDDAQPAGDPDAVWQQVLAAAGGLGMSLPDVEADFEARCGMPSSEASAGELAAYLQQLQAQGEQVPA